MGSASIDLSLANIWKSWYLFRRSKKFTKELEHFSYYLEENLYKLFADLNSGSYRHGSYRQFTVYDNKKRQISVAPIRDRVVHRLVYEYLNKIYDKIFIYDVWSCRKEKGLVGAIERTQEFLSKYSKSFIWKADIKKFFDNVDHKILLEILSSRIKDGRALEILKEIIVSYQIGISEREGNGFVKKGMPIGNLTSQIFANIYLNELDRLVKNHVKPLVYLRYGDDFIIIAETLSALIGFKEAVKNFISKNMWLEINLNHDIIIKARQGLKFLGVEIFPGGRRLSKRNQQRANSHLGFKNIASYSGLIKKHSNEKQIKYFDWQIADLLADIYEKFI